MTAFDDLFTTPFHEMSGSGRARVLQRLADTELFVALAGDPKNDRLELQVFGLPEGQVALACDTEDRLSAFFSDRPVAYAAMPGRALAARLMPMGIGLLVNPEEQSQVLVTPDMLGWLVKILDHASVEGVRRPAHLLPPTPEMVAALAEPLAARLADLSGLAQSAHLVAGDWEDDITHVLLIVGTDPAHQAAVAKAVAELAAVLDLPSAMTVGFPSAESVPPFAVSFEIAAQAPDSPVERRQRAPGSDPSKPPKLR